ncbi:RNA dependent RNA polymerase-domain-containing protein [Mycena maculata]|uniref:RNA-dependent RNA polymerase n=1 Tax=Mycena maculata TaxID=230809 RepID=A0AAD7HLG6_9AGAR|nr:RNA dependent RNA polymerase-domain-containing protein [Mycena maculata]
MPQTFALDKHRLRSTRLNVDLKTERDPRTGRDITKPSFSVAESDGHESRATRLVGDPKRFLAVSFTKSSKDQDIRKWLESRTQPGESIVYGQYKYVFFGFTENNLKAGHFGYGKYCARLALSFSSTVATLKIELEDYVLLPDLLAHDESVTSDGSGLIRDNFASEVAALLGLPSDTAVFQIRFGGVKGILARCPGALFDRLCGSAGKKIAFRESMVKYRGGPNILEVRQVSKPPKSGRLNKQFNFAPDRGIPLSVFEELLQMQLDAIDSITADREKALQVVDGEVNAEADGFFQDLYEMLLAGQDMNEPYLATLLGRFQKISLDALRNKLHIPVKGSGNFFGVVDHCDVLREGQVYINLPAKGGPQILGFSPFLATNHRSYIPESSPPSIPSVSRPTTALTVTIAGSTQVVSRPTIQRKDIVKDSIETFINLRHNSLLGELSNAWTKLVGTTPQLANLAQCKELVPMIEAALDIVKNSDCFHRLKYDVKTYLNKLKKTELQVPADWKNPLEVLAERVPESVAPVMGFTCDPQLQLAHQAETIMVEYNQALGIAIRADKEAKRVGLEEECKRADVVKAETIAEHFPAVENVSADLPKYLLKASVWYYVGYERQGESFAWLGGRWLNHIKAMHCGRVPIAVGARSTALNPAPILPSPITPQRHSARIPATPVSLPRPLVQPTPRTVPLSIDSESEEETSDSGHEVLQTESGYDTALEDLAPTTSTNIGVARPIVRGDSEDTLVGSEAESPYERRGPNVRSGAASCHSQSNDQQAGRAGPVPCPD